jgi:three-Cys-motif partner protein
MTSYNTDGTVGPWAEEKLDCLSKYLSAYTTIKKRFKGYFYVDAFAGAGKALSRKDQHIEQLTEDLFDLSGWTKDKDIKEYTEGSPARALSIQNPFSKYVFVETDDKKKAKLEGFILENYPRIPFQVLQEDANSVLVNRVVNNPRIDWKEYRAVAFLDPFGMQLPWSTIQKIANTKAIEVIINFPVGMAIQRLLQKHGEISSERRQNLDTYFGSPDWEEAVYDERLDLFGSNKVKVQDSGHSLARWYCARLKEEFGYVSSARLIRNSSGGHLYYLIFAGPNAVGASIANDILSQGEIVS